MKTYIIIFLLSVLSLGTLAQETRLSGKVVERDAQGKEIPLGMVGIKWLNSRITAMSADDGTFQIDFPDSMPSRLVAFMISYKSDTIYFADKKKTSIKVVLKSSVQTLGEVKVVGKQNATMNLITSTLNTELLSQKELASAACCNVSESFERNASVDVNFTDAVSGTKQIQMLGLDGIYTQILYENLPFVRGLSATHGLTFIPGPWVESILVTKGTGSVLNGYESITGQIQIEMQEPNKADRFFVNGYGSNEHRYELNAHWAKQFSENLSTLVLGHVSRNNLVLDVNMDRNKDGFMDMPFSEQYNLFNRWHFRVGEKAEGQFGFRFLDDDKSGGQNHRQDQDTATTHFGINIHNRQFETFTKNGFLFPDRPWKSMAIMTTERFHQVRTSFGRKRYEGEQKSLYINTINQGIIGTTFHKIKFGLSMIADDYKEKFDNGKPLAPDSIFDSQELIPGGYSEYTYSNDSGITIVGGVRADYFSTEGLMVNPRLHAKFNPAKDMVVRLSGGRGTRTPHLFVENAQLFASSRELLILEKLRPEVAWNYGITFTYCWKKLPLLGKDISINFDYFRTEFTNQVIVDLEDVHSIRFYNLDGYSYSNSFQTDFTFSPFNSFDVKMAYKLYDVRSTYSGVLKEKPLVPQHRALMNLDYATEHEKWKFNFTFKWFGSSRLPNTSGNPTEFQRPERSPAYYTLMGQITKKYRLLEFYVGGENLLDYRIKDPIIDPLNPYGSNFDATMIWGPVSGRVIYGGFRFRII